MNQGKLEVVKEEMARVNIDILEIHELNWTGKGKFNSDDHYIYFCGQESLRRNGADFRGKKKNPHKTVQNALHGYNLKTDKIILVPFQGKSINIIMIQVMPQPIMPKNLELTGSMKTYKTFYQSVSSVAQSCPTLCDPMNCSMPGLPVHHQPSEFTQTHVH